MFYHDNELQYEVEHDEFNYAFLSTNVEPQEETDLPWTTGTSIDEEGEYSFLRQLNLDGAPLKVSKPEAQAYNEPVPQNED